MKLGKPTKHQLSLFLLRISVFVVMLFWTLDKFINPDHSAKVFQHFYFIGDAGVDFLKIIGGIQLIIILAFVLGYKKRWSYGLVFAMHLVSTVSSFNQYLNPWPNLLFFAAWPMLAACLALVLLKEDDRLLSVEK